MTRAAFSCPSWCPLPADHDPQDAADGGRHHPAPTFGLLAGMTWDDGGDGWHVEASAIFQNTDADEFAAGLRDLAASALAAAEWLEGQR